VINLQLTVALAQSDKC